MQPLEDALATLAASLLPGGRLVSYEPLRPDATGGEAEKALGYGEPVRLTVRDAAGDDRHLVFRTEAENEFGHERLGTGWPRPCSRGTCSTGRPSTSSRWTWARSTAPEVVAAGGADDAAVEAAAAHLLS